VIVVENRKSKQLLSFAIVFFFSPTSNQVNPNLHLDNGWTSTSTAIWRLPSSPAWWAACHAGCLNSTEALHCAGLGHRLLAKGLGRLTLHIHAAQLQLTNSYRCLCLLVHHDQGTSRFRWESRYR